MSSYPQRLLGIDIPKFCFAGPFGLSLGKICILLELVQLVQLD